MADPAAAGPVTVPDHRLGPRRRGDRLLADVHAAVLAELAERGYARLTVEAVAARARVSKASLYRRWPGKPELVLAAVSSALPDPETLADTGSLRGDLVAFFRSVAAHLAGPAGPALRGVLADAGSEPGSAAELYGHRHRRRSAEQLRILLDRAVARGELSAVQVDALPPRAWEAGPAVLRHHFLWEGRVDDALPEQLVDEVVLPLVRAASG